MTSDGQSERERGGLVDETVQKMVIASEKVGFPFDLPPPPPDAAAADALGSAGEGAGGGAGASGGGKKLTKGAKLKAEKAARERKVAAKAAQDEALLRGDIEECRLS